MSVNTEVLVVDDNVESLRFLGEVVRSKGYKAFEAEDAFSALNFMENNTFQAAILDVVLPDISGIELMSKLRKIDPDLPVIIVTGAADLESAVKALSDGAEEYLLKPINVLELQAILDKVTIRRRVLEQKKHLEDMLRHSKDKYRKGVSRMDDAIILVENLRSRIVDANSKASEMTGYNIQDLLKMTLYDLFPAIMHEELKQIIKKIKRCKQDLFSHLMISRRDGKSLPIEAHGHIILYEGKKFMQFICHDISERKEVEDRVWRSRRFTTFSEIANMAKDQMSSPLTAILGQTEALKSRINTKNPSVMHSIRSIEKQVSKVKELLDHLHVFADLQSGTEVDVKKRKVKSRRFNNQTPPRSISSNKKRILVVDDEPAMREVLQDFFTLNSYEVLTSKDGLDGYNRFLDDNVDLVVTDLTMPRMDGVELLKGIKNHNNPVPVILMTGINLNQVDDIAKKYGADGYIMKPFSFYQMMKLVQEVLGKNFAVTAS